MTRIGVRLLTLLIIGLSDCALETAEPKIIAATPAGVELSCVAALGSCRSAQAVADAAEAYCQQQGLHARARMTNIAPSGNEVAAFDCVALGAR